MKNKTLSAILRDNEVESVLWDLSCKLEDLKNDIDSDKRREELFSFEQRVDNLREDIIEYAYWLEDEED
jgi:hypothetical protein